MSCWCRMVITITSTSRRSRDCRLSFFLTGPPPSEISPLSLHDALPIFRLRLVDVISRLGRLEILLCLVRFLDLGRIGDEIGRSTRLNSSHVETSYAVFCLKKKTSQRSRHRLRRAA